MTLSSELRRGRTRVFLMHVHLVFVAKYRRKTFTQEVLDALERIFSDVCAKFGAQLVKCSGENDHVHLLVNYAPKVAVSHLVNSLKGVSSRLIRKRGFPSVTHALWGKAL